MQIMSPAVGIFHSLAPSGSSPVAQRAASPQQVAPTETLSLSNRARASDSAGKAESHRNLVAGSVVMAGLLAAGGGMAVTIAAAASVLAAPSMLAVGITSVILGAGAVVGGISYGDKGKSAGPSDPVPSLADPGNPVSPFHPGNPANPINLQMF